MARALVLADEAPYIPLERLLDQPLDLDLVLCLGDLRQNDLEALERAALPKFGVHGNHDDGDEFVGLGIEDVHLRRVEVDGLTLGGFSGAHHHDPKGPFDWSQGDSERLLRGFDRVDVMIAHSPPLGVNDDADDPVHVGLWVCASTSSAAARRCSCTATPIRRCRWDASARPRSATCAVIGSSTCPCADVGHPTMHASWAAATTRGRVAWRGAALSPLAT